VSSRAALELGLHVVLEMPDQELGHDPTISRYLALRQAPFLRGAIGDGALPHGHPGVRLSDPAAAGRGA
jgi:hypothetical protein